VPLLRRIVAAHQLHHTGRFDGVPWGMFLGPQEVEALPGGRRELDKMVAAGAVPPS
jgi:beta-carotene 3-hydroxylase